MRTSLATMREHAQLLDAGAAPISDSDLLADEVADQVEASIILARKMAAQTKAIADTLHAAGLPQTAMLESLAAISNATEDLEFLLSNHRLAKGAAKNRKAVKHGRQ